MNKESINYPDGSKYKGETWDGKRHGQGVWQRPDGTRYAGEWKNDRPDGQGTISWPDGKKYVGQWKNGKRHGQGAEIYPDGKMIEGEWEAGIMAREITTDSQPVFDKRAQGQPGSRGENKVNFQAEGKSFFASLFDINMKEMVTPKIIRVIYVIGIILIGLGALGAILSAILAVGTTGAGALLAAIIVVPLASLLGVIFLRIYLEIIILLFNIYDQLKDIKSFLLKK